MKNKLIILIKAVLFLFTLSYSTYAKSSLNSSCHAILKVENRLDQVLTPDESKVIQALEQAILSPGELEGRAQLLIQNIESKLSKPNHTPSVIDHAALSYIYLNKILEPLGLQQEIETLLIKITNSITKTEVTKSDLGKRLPRRFLYQTKPDALVFYNTSFRDPNNNNPDTLAELLKNYNPLRKDIFILTLSSLTLTASAFYNLGAEYIAASFMGLFITGLAEHMFHGYGAHASEKLKDHPLLGKTFKKMEFNHAVIHHGVTFNSYINQFDSPEHQSRVDQLIDKRIDYYEFHDQYKNNLVQDSEYGLVLSKKDYLILALPIFTITAVSSYFLGFDLGVTSLLSIPTLFYPAGVNFTHKYMHMSRAEVKEATVGRPILRAFLKSRYVSLMAQIHYVHHERYNTNYNLLYLFTDALLGRMKLPNLKELAQMRQHDGLGLTSGQDSLD